MKWRDAILAAAGGALLLISVWAIRNTGLPGRNVSIVAGECRVPATVIESPGNEAKRAAIVIHGLSANRHVMRILGETLAAEGNLRAYLIDLPGHGDNTEAFSFPRAEECAAAVVEKLLRDGTISAAQTAVVGHSMGGAIVTRLADDAPVAATVAISPAPMILPRRMPSNLLVLSAQYDFPPLREQARVLAQAAGGDRTAIDDFAQRRAFHLENVAGANHTSVLVDPRVAEQAGSWVRAALDPMSLRDAGVTGWGEHALWRPGPPQGFPGISPARTWTASVAPVVGVIGLVLMFPWAARVVGRKETGGGPGRENKTPRQMQNSHLSWTPGRGLLVVEGGMFALVGVVLLKVGVPLSFLRTYSGDYLASLLSIFGLLLLAFNRRAAKDWWSCDGRGVAAGTVLGFAVMLAFGAWLNWRVTDLWLNGARWMRFAGLLPFCFLFSSAEEAVLGPVQGGKQRIWRFGVFLILRLELWLAAAFAYYALVSGNVLIGVLGPTLAGFSILQRLGTDEIRTRSGSAVASAVFGAILAAWFIAALFPLT